MIDGVTITPLKQILDERGKVMHMMKNSDPIFSEFGEIYFSRVFPGAVKAWHIHDKMTINYAVPHGKIKLVLFDERENSPTRGELNEIFLGEHFGAVGQRLQDTPRTRAIGAQAVLQKSCDLAFSIG